MSQDRDVIHMIITASEDEDRSITLSLKKGGDQYRNRFECETYRCLADYWQERLVKKEQES